MMRGKDWQIIGAGAVLTAILVAVAMIWIDQPLALFMAQYRETRTVRVFDVITDLANSGIWYALALAGIAWAWYAARADGTPEGKALYDRRVRAGVFVIASMVASGLLVNALKTLIGRTRPKLFVYDGIYGYEPLQHLPWNCSFPSGHAQSIFAAMIALAILFPRFRIPLIAFAAFISATRIIVGAHYLSDVFAGAYFAFAVALIVQRWFERQGKHLALAAHNPI